MTPKQRAALAAVVLLAATAARADQWATPTPRDYRSASGGYVFRVVPTEANWFKPAEGTLVSRDRDGKETVVWRKQLVNLPNQAFVADDGRHVVTIDSYARLGYQHVLVLYGAEGKLLADYELEDLLKPEEIRDRVMTTVSSRHWAGDTKFAFGRDDKELTITLKWGRTITLDPATGKLNPKLRDVPPLKDPNVAPKGDPDRPPLTDVLNASALNRLLDELNERPAKGGERPAVPLKPETLGRVTVVARNGGPDVGVLRAWPRLRWPEVLRAPACQGARERIDSLLPAAIEQARKQPVSADQARDLDASVKALGQYLVDHANELTPSQFIEGRRHLNTLEEGLKALQNPGVSKALAWNARLADEGKTAADLVRFLADQQLRFARAVAAEDTAAYQELYQALRAFQKGERPTGERR
jgi:hypothetical protein